MILTHWGETPVLSVPDIDREHTELIEMANAFAGALDGDASRAELDLRLRHLIVEFQNHCASEEELMQSHAYPGLASHADEHRKLVAQMTALRDDLSAGAVSLCNGLGQFVRIWTEQHIAGADANFAGFLHGQNRRNGDAR
jgi:hemerythrin-like metal-binding protein